MNDLIRGLDRLGRVTLLLAGVGTAAILAREIINRGSNAALRYVK